MSLYELFALLISSVLGYRVFRAIGTYVTHRLFCLYFTSSPSRFNAIYDVTESSYDYLKDIFKIKAEHYKYVEAMRAFEEHALEQVKDIRPDFAFYKKYLVQTLPYIGIPSLLFIPVWQYYLTGLILGFVLPVIYKLIKDKYTGDYATLVSITLAERAYKYKYNRRLNRRYKEKLNQNKTARQLSK